MSSCVSWWAVCRPLPPPAGAPDPAHTPAFAIAIALALDPVPFSDPAPVSAIASAHGLLQVRIPGLEHRHGG